MRVTIDPAVLNDPSYYELLDKIILYFLGQRHLWQVSNPLELKQSAWLQSDNGRAGQRNLAAFEKCVVSSIYHATTALMHSNQIEIVREPRTAVQLTLECADRTLSTPVYVVVENSHADGEFVNTMIAAFGLHVLCEAQTEGWWQFQHAGGNGEISKRIRELQANHFGILRVMAITDSDSEYEGHVTAPVRALTAFCAENRVPLVVLKKRKIENYIPISILGNGALGYRLGKVRRYGQLTPEQRDFYDMKSGFRLVDGEPVVPASQAQLYEVLNGAVIRTLSGGFGDDIAELFCTKRPEFNEVEIRGECRDAGNEIESMLRELEKLL